MDKKVSGKSEKIERKSSGAVLVEERPEHHNPNNKEADISEKIEERPIYEFPLREKEKLNNPKFQNEEFSKVREKVVLTPPYFQELYKGVRQMAEGVGRGRATDVMAGLQNALISACLNLTEHNAKIILGEFARNAKRYVFERYRLDGGGDAKVSAKMGELLEGGALNHLTDGVWPVVEALARRQNSPLHHGKKRMLGFNDWLDSREGVDFVELIYSQDKNGVSVERMDLVQVKNKSLGGKEKEYERDGLHNQHKEWVQRAMIAKEKLLSGEAMDVRMRPEFHVRLAEGVLDLFLIIFDKFEKDNSTSLDMVDILTSLRIPQMSAKARARYFRELLPEITEAVEAVGKELLGLEVVAPHDFEIVKKSFLGIIEKEAAKVPKVSGVLKIRSVVVSGGGWEEWAVELPDFGKGIYLKNE